jgi:hypothetical protein
MSTTQIRSIAHLEKGLEQFTGSRVGGAPTVQKGIEWVNEGNFYVRIFRNELLECLGRFLERTNSRQMNCLSKVAHASRD